MNAPDIEPLCLNGAQVSLTAAELALQYKATPDPSRHIMIPGDLVARNEKVRTLREQGDIRSASTICYALGKGSGGRLETRVGGVPYWPRDLPWPVGADGLPLTFVAQFSLKKANCLVRFPGDLLTVHYHFDTADEHGSGEAGDARLTWHDTADLTSIPTIVEVPLLDSQPATVGSFYAIGVACRDFKRFDATGTGVMESDADDFRDLTLHAFKLGGFAPVYGDNWRELITGIERPVFLCSLATVDQAHIAQSSAGHARQRPADEGAQGGFRFPGGGVFVVVFEADNPAKLHWFTYLP